MLFRSADLLLMDELGFLERDALLFQREVIASLDGRTPVLGVLRDMEIPWHAPILAHPLVKTLRIDEKNRDALPERIADYFDLA